MKSIHRKEYKKLLDALVAARKAKGITQQDLADALGKPQSYISKIENGERRLDILEFNELCKIIEVSPAEILGDK